MATVVTNGRLASYDFKVPQGGDKVYKDECMYCFDTPISDSGLYVCLSSLLAVCNKHLKLLIDKRKTTVFLHLKKIQREIISINDGSPPEKKPTKLAIGVEGGFDVDKEKVEYEDVNSLIVTDDKGTKIEQYLLPDSNLPLNAQLSIATILAHQGASLQSEVQAWEEKRKVSKHAATLPQLDNGVKILPSGWKCALCDLTENLWLNLTDGTILCGRKYFDGSGGNNHAVEYYQRTKYPLAVKLGTINAEGGDVYSYDEDDMVEDPKLAEHLKHFGINIAVLEKTDKTMTELEIEANLSLKAEWDTIQESGEKLTPLFGPGYTGMVNLGNSCYLNSLMQTLFSIEEVQHKYGSYAEEIFQRSAVDPPLDFNVQMAKLALGLWSGLYSMKPDSEKEEPLGVRPQMFKHLIGHGHPEFSTNHQQDVQEYFLHIMDFMEKNESYSNLKIKDLFRLEFEDKIECLSSNKVSYKKREEMIWALPIPLDAAINRGEYEEFEARRSEAEKMKTRIDPKSVVRLKIPMQACIDRFASVDVIDDFYSSAIKGKTTAKKITKFSTFPDYLIIQLQKFTIGEDWTPKKLDVSVDVLDVIDLTQYRGKGLQPNEEELPQDDGQQQPSSEPVINEEFVGMLMDMGFPMEACKKAVHYTNNQGVEAAMNWVLEHSQDPDFAMPLLLKQSNGITPDPSLVAMIVSMGFTEPQAMKALKKNENNIEQATEWMFSHMDELNEIETEEPPLSVPSSESKPTFHDGDGKYELFAFISHMGTSTSCGHYVCHIVKDGRWVIFNDRKVAVSVNPPKDLGYLYFYRRTHTFS